MVLQRLKQVGKIVVVTALIVGTLGLTACNNVSLNDYQNMQEKFKLAEQSANDRGNEIGRLNGELNDANDNVDTLTSDLSTLTLNYDDLEILKDAEIETLRDNIESLSENEDALKEELAEKIAELESMSVEEFEQYLWEKDEITLGTSFGETLDDRDVSILADGKFKYNGESINFHEEFTISDDVSIMTSEHDKDFGLEPYMILDGDDTFTYTFNIEEDIDFDFDEELVINFLGNEMSISDLGIDEIEISLGNLLTLSADETTEVDGKIISLVGANSDGPSIIIEVDDVRKTLKEGNSKTINGVDVFVDEIFITNIGTENFAATLRVGNEVTETIEDGDEYFDNDEYKWIVESNETTLTTLGVEYVEKQNDLNDDVIGLGDSFNFLDFAELEFSEIVGNEDYMTLDFEFDDEALVITSNLDDSIRVNGEEVDDNEIRFDGTDVMYELDGEEENTTDISDVSIENDKVELTLEWDSSSNMLSLLDLNLGLELDISDEQILGITYKGIPYDNEDENYLVNNGMKLYNPEDAIEDNEFSIDVPNDNVTAIVKLV